MVDQQIERISAARRRKFFWRAGLTVAVIAFLGIFIGLIYYGAKPPVVTGVDSFPEVSRNHIGLSDTPAKPYNSNPPSSGDHHSYPANWGAYDYEVNDKIFVHNLEHGGIWISYKPSTPAAAISQLTTFVNNNGHSKLVIAPRSANDSDIAVVAWTKVMKVSLANGTVSQSDMDRIAAFYKAFRDRGPEFVPDGMPGIDPKSVQ